MSWVQHGPGQPSVPGAKDVPSLRPMELFEKRRARDSSRLKAQNTILEQIHARILTASRQTSDAYLMYTIPPFILGLPRLDLEDCVVQVVQQLRQQGQEVRQTQPNLLLISWAHHEKEQLSKESPITQAMTPLHTEKKQQTTRVRFQEDIVQKAAPPPKPRLGAMSPLGSFSAMSQNPVQNTPAPPRDVHSQKPPTSFLDAVERPSQALPTKKDVLEDLWNF